MTKIIENGVGTKFGEYMLLKKIAAGGMGEIFLAKQTGPIGFEKILVIKRILQHHLENEQYVNMFRSEARVAAMLSHSNVVQVYSMGEVDEHLYLAMEYVHGRSIKEVVTRSNNLGHPVPLHYVADIIAQACAGLSYSHNLKDAADQPLNLIHRDINPHNMLVSYHGELKIIDFGIAKSTMSVNKTETGTIKGKFIYMSPEQSAAEVLDKRSDIFSLTIVLYEMLAGINPFQHDNIVLSLEAIQRKDPPPITDYRPDAEAFEPILRKGLAKKPEDRYFDASEMRDDLQRLLLNKVLPKPTLSLSDWLESIFADSIDADKQVLLETGSGISRSLSGIKGPVANRKSTKVQLSDSQILASNPEADLGSAWSQPKPTPKSTTGQKKQTKKTPTKTGHKAKKQTLDDEDTQGFEIPEEEPTKAQRIPAISQKDLEAPTIALEQNQIDQAVASALQNDAADQISSQDEKTAFSITPDEATSRDQALANLQHDEETQAFFVSENDGEDFDDEATQRMPSLEEADDFGDLPIDTLKHGKRDIDLDKPFAKTNSKLALLLGLALGFIIVIGAFFLLHGGDKSDPQSSPDAATSQIATGLQRDASQRVADAKNLDHKSSDTDIVDRAQQDLLKADEQKPDAHRPDINSGRTLAQFDRPLPTNDASKNLKPDANFSRAAKQDAGTTQKSPKKHQKAPGQSKPKSKAKLLGTIVVNPGPNMRAIWENKGGRGAQNFHISKRRGRFRIKGGSKKFAASFDYQVQKKGIALSINSYPWSIVSLNGISQGRTPVKLASGRRFSVEFRGPQLQDTVRVIIFFRDPD